MTPCHYYCILLVRSESLGRAHYEWEGITQDVNIRRQEPFQRLPTMSLVVFLMYEALPLDPERTPCSLYTEAQDYFSSVNFMGLGVCVLVECSSHLFFLPPTLQFLFSFCSSFLASSALLLLSILTSHSDSLCFSIISFFKQSPSFQNSNPLYLSCYCVAYGSSICSQGPRATSNFRCWLSNF